jgi:hypothetical protein
MLTYADVAAVAVAGLFLFMIVALLRGQDAKTSASPETTPEECPTCGRAFTVEVRIDWRPKT